MKVMNDIGITRQSRLTNGLLVVITVFIVLMFVVGIVDYQKRMSTYSCDPTPVVVSQGDTLWSIAWAHCYGRVVNAVDDLVIKYGAVIVQGQEIQLISKP